MGAKKALIAAVLALVPNAGQAQKSTYSRLLDSQVGTLSVTPNPIFSNGTLTGCTVVFTAIQRDLTGKKERFVKVDGSFGFIQMKSEVGVSLKLLVQDIDDETLGLKPSAPATVYFVAQDGLRNSSKSRSVSIPSDTPGATMVAYPAEVGDFLMEALERNKMTVAFARTSNGIDIRVPIDLTVKQTKASGEKFRDPDNLDQVLQCVLKLMKAGN